MISSFSQKYRPLWSLPVVVAALGYFVDVYDLVLFGVVRVKSMIDLGFTVDEAKQIGGSILNWQMGGLLLGGILWGVLGDKKGRLSVLFGSIILYSLSNLACGSLPYWDVDKSTITTLYMMFRFIAGIGLAGELGAGITLVAEVLPTKLRALGTSFVAGIGLSGAIFANLTFVWTNENWSLSYLIGGAMGLALLLLRLGVLESGIFNLTKSTSVERGNFFLFFQSKKRFSKYIKCIAIGMPTWFCIGILAMKADEFAPVFGGFELKPGDAVMWGYIGISFGDIFAGLLSHWLKSRKKAVLFLLIFTSLPVLLFLIGMPTSRFSYLFLCCWFGFGTGYWAMFMTLSAEQFGTNIRSTATTTIPNFVRGTVVFMTWGFDFLKNGYVGVLGGAAVIGFICFALATFAVLTIAETHGKELDFIEE